MRRFSGHGRCLDRLQQVIRNIQLRHGKVSSGLFRLSRQRCLNNRCQVDIREVELRHHQLWCALHRIDQFGTLATTRHQSAIYTCALQAHGICRSAEWRG